MREKLKDHIRAVVEGIKHLSVDDAADLIAALTRKPIPTSIGSDWQWLEQEEQPRLSDGYTAVRAVAPGKWMVRGAALALDLAADLLGAPPAEPDADERHAMVAVIQDTMIETLKPSNIADALLAAGWTRKRAADVLIEAEKRGAERMRERAAAIADQFDAKRFYETYRAEYNRKRYDVAGVERMQRKALNIQAEDARDAIRALPLTEENTDDE